MLGLIRQIEFQLPIDSIDPLVIPAKAFDVAQVEKAQAKATIPLRLRQADQLIGDGITVLITDGLVALIALAQAKCSTSVANICLTWLDCRQSHGKATAGSCHFFCHGLLEHVRAQLSLSVKRL